MGTEARVTQPRLGRCPAVSISRACFLVGGGRGVTQPQSVPSCVVMGLESWFLGGRASAKQQVFSKHGLCALGRCFMKVELVKMRRWGSFVRDAATAPKA